MKCELGICSETAGLLANLAFKKEKLSTSTIKQFVNLSVVAELSGVQSKGNISTYQHIRLTIKKHHPKKCLWE